MNIEFVQNQVNSNINKQFGDCFARPRIKIANAI